MTRPFRSVLYIPGSKERALEKARDLAADAIIFDLEDAVAPEEKGAARATLARFLEEVDYAPRVRIVRINGFDTDWGRADAAAFAGHPGADAVLVPKGSPIKTVADLKGKKVAFGKGSSAQNVTLKALVTAGLTFKDIEPAYLSPADATAAFNGGNIDAWTVWDPYYAIAETRYEARVIADTSDKRLVSSSYYMAHRDFASRYPTVLSAVLDEIRKVTVKAGQNREELAALAAEATGIDAKAWLIAFRRAEFTLGPVTDAHIAQQQQLADSFLALGIIPRKINVGDIVWRTPAN